MTLPSKITDSLLNFLDRTGRFYRRTWSLTPEANAALEAQMAAQEAVSDDYPCAEMSEGDRALTGARAAQYRHEYREKYGNRPARRERIDTGLEPF